MIKRILSITSKCLYHAYAVLGLFFAFVYLENTASYQQGMFVVAKAQAKALILLTDSIMGGLRL